MKKILQICVEGNTGSTGRIAEAIGSLTIQNGWESHIAIGRYLRPSMSNIIKIGTFADNLTHGLETRLFDRHCFGSRFATRKLVNEIIALKPDIIHLHHLHGYYINIKILFNYLAKTYTPVIWTFHDCWSITGHCCYFDFVKCDKWKSECNHCPQKKEYPASYFVDRSNKNFNQKKELFTSVPKMKVIVVSNWLDSVVRDSFMANIPRKIIYNGIDVEVFKPEINSKNIKEKLRIGNAFMMLGVASPWSKRKGLSDFIELGKLIHKTDYIVLVGLNKSQKKKLPPNIIGLDRIENQQQLKDLYATADVFLNLSVEETFGLTTAEALSCGTPAIVYDATACPEVVDTNTGIIVNKNDINGLLEAIESIKKNGKKNYSDACRARAVNLFNNKDRYNDYIELYNEILFDETYKS